MPRTARYAPPGHFLHITQRGNYRQQTFFSDADRYTFLDLLSYYATTESVDIQAFCLMPNHYHLVARANSQRAISDCMRGLNGQYSRYLHGRLTRTGRLWQSRFYSCVLSNKHFLAALRYVESNPVRSRLTADAAQYRWSSAAIHCGVISAPDWFASADFPFAPEEWRQQLAIAQPRNERNLLRATTYRERSLAHAA